MSRYSDWVDNELKLACNREHSDSDGEYFDSCYVNAAEAAKKAYEELESAGHSGMSHSIALGILHRLLDHKPLTPITDEDFESEPYAKCETHSDYQNHRYHPLFKTVLADGTVTYRDIDRVIAFDVDNPKSTWISGFVDKHIEELFPTTLPYTPPNKPYKVAVKEHLHDKALGDFDMCAILYVITPKGERLEINKFYKTVFDHWYKYSSWEPEKGALVAESDWIEITKEEFEALVAAEQIETVYDGISPVEVIPFPVSDSVCGG